jgi:integrase
MPTHELIGGKLQVYRRKNSRFWQCSASVGGKQRKSSTKQESLVLARQVAEDWYPTLMGKSRAGLLMSEKTFRQASEQFLKEYEIITEGQRSPRWVEGHRGRLRLHLVPFFGELGVSQVTPGKVQEYRVHRATTPPVGKLPTYKQPARAAANNEPAPAQVITPAKYRAPARSTLHDEIVTLRQVLKTAVRHAWLAYLPDLSPPYRTQGEVVHRPWFSPAEYKQLYEATRAYAREPFHEHYRWNAEQVHDYVLFMANTGLRPDEARNIQHRDVVIAEDEATGERILEIEVRGKRGVGFCKSMPSAVRPYERLLARATPSKAESRRERQRRRRDGSVELLPVPPKQEFPAPMDHVFPGNHIKLFNGVLGRTKLKLDRDGNRRTAYSLRHTYICMRLMEGADIYQIAKNCRTSVEMIEKFYAAHIKNTLDAAAINVRRPKPAPAKKPSARQKALAADDDDE